MTSGGQVLETYKVNDQVTVEIVDLGHQTYYMVREPEITEEERRVVERVKEMVVKDDKLSREVIKLVGEGGSAIRESGEFREKVRKLIEKVYKKTLRVKEVDPSRVDVVYYYVKRDILGNGKLTPLFLDPNVEDIHILGPAKRVYVWHVKYEQLPTNILIMDAEELERHVQRLLLKSGKHVSYTKPIVDGTLRDFGYRVHVVHRSVSTQGTQIVVRKHKEIPFTVYDLIKAEVAPPEVFAYLWLLLDNKRSILVVGETAAGKTTLLNAIVDFIPRNMKVVVIEEVRELRLQHHENVSYLTVKESVDSVGRVTLFDLVKASLRQRPDYIIVGEIRGEEAYALFQAMMLGHGGLATMHADDPVSTVKRLLMKPLSIPPYMVVELDTIVHITKMRVGRRVSRYVVSVADLVSIDDRTMEPEFSYVFRQTVIDDKVEKSFDIKQSHVIRKLSETKGVPIDYYYRDFRRRLETLKARVYGTGGGVGGDE